MQNGNKDFKRGKKGVMRYTKNTMDTVSTEFNLFAHGWPMINCEIYNLLLVPEIDPDDRRVVVNAISKVSSNMRRLT